MKKWSFLILVIAMVAGTGNLKAATFNETFLEDQNWVLGFGYSAVLNFDLTASSNIAFLYDRHDNLIDMRYPSEDQDGFVPEEYIVTGGTLSLTLSSLDLWPEVVEIYDSGDMTTPIGSLSFGFGEMGTLIFHDWLLLFPIFNSAKETAVLNIDLGLSGLLADLDDGLFSSLVFAPPKDFRNDISIDSVSLLLEASRVPVPATVLLLGSGLAGLLGWRRKSRLSARDGGGVH